jgi:hypothetical protein
MLKKSQTAGPVDDGGQRHGKAALDAALATAQDAELVAIGIGQDHPGRVRRLPDIAVTEHVAADVRGRARQTRLVLHVTSAANRPSILRHGLDWNYMGAAPGIAGSRTPEVAGIFLCRAEWELEWFIEMNNTGGPVDVWEVAGVAEADLVDAGSGLFYLPRAVPPGNLELVRRDVPPCATT